MKDYKSLILDIVKKYSLDTLKRDDLISIKKMFENRLNINTKLIEDLKRSKDSQMFYRISTLENQIEEDLYALEYVDNKIEYYKGLIYHG